ncbi:nickel/cobalt efflux protein RcnA [Pandoraea apista]|uniref:Nickel/cobalt efflux system n=1 Tax=Pandoraea apista TaxID=93218 RepID=A0ABX9ZSE0_9BURK|nr:nickel/cobalt efflux protein RcnA [Pandoraea apista]AVF38924.1 nickel/cobalt efflux protein RcnA [Pandoraea apista]PTE02307.1 nickel/cobalt efflux protein RcnA [Pandoraea apista]RRJ80820.1 nickel/cobalt efflux protein RcnA [Pandoraea apista]RSD17452.1 nickel/cobalt efflux protein RcnA [Pandoraea apista]RSD17489.1 nickel/cobalt efflux protein RcnA [Pandoraea apista]
MTEFSTLLQQGNAWLFIPSAILLGALHGLEPGHSKTMMAAFIVAIRGTVGQAVLLGLSATASHTAVVWLVALAGMYFGRNWDTGAFEPYFQLASGALILAVAGWMLWRTWRDNTRAHDHEHSHSHSHSHSHDHDHAHASQAQHARAIDLSCEGYRDAHERAHARDIRKRFTGRDVTTGQIVVFGLTGGLVPCPASITVLLLCLQLKRFALGAGLVLCFSMGLAITMVASGTLAALSVRHMSRRWSGFGEFARKAPYFSGGLIVLVGLYVGYQGAAQLLFAV